MKFKVFQGTGGKLGGKPKPEFYFHVRSTNGKITLASEGYPTLAHAFRAVAQVWKSFAKAYGIGGFGFAVPIPYTRDSLRPVAGLPKLTYRTAKQAMLARTSTRLKKVVKRG